MRNNVFFVFVFFVLFEVALTVFLLEPFDSTGCIDELLFAGVEGVASVADFHTELRFGGSGDKLVPATTSHIALYVFWMDIGFHGSKAPALGGSRSISGRLAVCPSKWVSGRI